MYLTWEGFLRHYPLRIITKLWEKGHVNLLAFLWKECMKNSTPSGEDSRFNEREGRKAVRQQASGMLCEDFLHAGMRNGMFVFVNLLPCYPPWCSKSDKFKICLINMSLKAMNNSFCFKQPQGLEDRLNCWVLQ